MIPRTEYDSPAQHDSQMQFWVGLMVAACLSVLFVALLVVVFVI